MRAGDGRDEIVVEKDLVLRRALPAVVRCALVVSLSLSALGALSAAGCARPPQPTAATPTSVAAASLSREELSRRVTATLGLVALAPGDGTLAAWAATEHTRLETRWASGVRGVLSDGEDVWVIQGDVLAPTHWNSRGVCEAPSLRLPDETVAVAWVAPPSTPETYLDFYALTRDGSVWRARTTHWQVSSHEEEAVRARGECASSGSPRSPTYELVRELPPSRDLQAVGDHLCALATDGRVICLEEPRPRERWVAPLPRAASHWVSARSGLCVLDEASDVYCMRPGDAEPGAPWDSGRYVGLAALYDTACAQLADGHVRCVDPSFHGGESPRPPLERGRSVTLPVTGHLLATRDSVCSVGDDLGLTCARPCDAGDAECSRDVFTLSASTPPGGEVVIDYVATRSMSCVATVRGVRCWPRRRYGGPQPSARELRVPGSVAHLFAQGQDRLCMVTTDGVLHCSEVLSFEGPEPLDPGWVQLLDEVRDLAYSESAFCAAVGDLRQVHCGGTIRSQLGLRETPHDPSEPQRLGGASLAANAIAMGLNHACAVLEGGRVACMGDGVEGQLGLGAQRLFASAFEVVPRVAGARVIEASGSRTCVQDVDGNIDCWGESRAFHPVRNADAAGALFPLHLSPSHSLWCVGGDGMVCDRSVTRLYPWETRPRLRVVVGEGLLNFRWMRGPGRVLCEEQVNAFGGQICYTDGPIRAARDRVAEAMSDWQRDLEPTLDDLPAYPPHGASRARIYQLERRDGCENPMASRRRWDAEESCPGLWQRGRSIPPRELARVTAALNDVTAFPPYSTCFRPHHEIVYFDAQRRPVARVVFCLGCGTMTGLPRIPAQSVNWGNVSPRGVDLAALCRVTGVGECG